MRRVGALVVDELRRIEYAVVFRLLFPRAYSITSGSPKCRAETRRFERMPHARDDLNLFTRVAREYRYLTICTIHSANVYFVLNMFARKKTTVRTFVYMLYTQSKVLARIKRSVRAIQCLTALNAFKRAESAIRRG